VVEFQSFRQAIRTRYRRANSLKEQHSRHQQFSHKADLLLVNAIDDKNFRRKLSDLNKGRFHITWQIEHCKTQSHVHYHAIIRTTATIEDFRQYISDCLSHRKGQPPKTRFKLNIEEIDNSKAEGLFTYNSKASIKLMKQVAPQQKGSRTIFATGKPWDKPPKQLHTDSWKREKRQIDYSTDAEILCVMVRDYGYQLAKYLETTPEPTPAKTTTRTTTKTPATQQTQSKPSWTSPERLRVSGPRKHRIRWTNEFWGILRNKDPTSGPAVQQLHSTRKETS
jgi:hypothetical protein